MINEDFMNIQKSYQIEIPFWRTCSIIWASSETFAVSNWAERAVRAVAQTLPTVPQPVLQAHVRNCIRLIEQWDMTVPEAEFLQQRAEEVYEKQQR